MGFAPWSPNEPTEGLIVPPDPQLCFIFQFKQNAIFFPSWLTVYTIYTLCTI